MATEVTTIRLSQRDIELIDHFIVEGEFGNKSELIRFAVKKLVYEMMLNELRRKYGRTKAPSKKEVKELFGELEDIRKELWKDYAKRVS
jgi:Arc/MetJ-type ribon-helix-helix transcriptional regulator